MPSLYVLDVTSLWVLLLFHVISNIILSVLIIKRACSPLHALSGPCEGQVLTWQPGRKASWQTDCYHLFLPASTAKDPGTSALVQHVWCQKPCCHCFLLIAPNTHGREGWTVWRNLHSLLDNLKTWKDSLSLDSRNSFLSSSIDIKKNIKKKKRLFF